MNTEQLWNRATNLVATSIVGLAGFAFAAEIFVEDEWAYKIDDILLLLLGFHAISWYLRKDNRYKHAKMPIIVVWVALLVKIGAIFMEFKDAADVGDDLGALILFVLASIFVTWLYNRKMPS